MGLKVASSSSLHLSQPSVHHSPSSSHTLASAFFSPSSKRRSSASGNGALFCRYTDRVALFMGAHQTTKLLRSRSLDSKKSKVRIVRRALTASLDSFFSDEDFSKQIEELAQKFQINQEADESLHRRLGSSDAASSSKFLENLRPFDPIEPPDFPERDEIIPANIERRANSVEIPLSLRMIKRKKQWQEGLMEAGESACCSVKKAFSSMVFIIRELHSFTLQMREVLFYEDLHGILENVQREMHASFVWLFEKVFSHTPTLMVSVMILLANYSVYSMSSNAAIAASLGVQPYAVTSTVMEDNSNINSDLKIFDPSIVRAMNLPSSSSNSGKSTPVEGNTGGGGGGGNYKVVGSGMDGDGRFDGSNYDRTITPRGPQSVGTSGTESSRVEEEAALWDSFVEEASEMSGGEVVDQESVGSFVSPIHAKIESDDYSDYSKMEMLYQTQLYHEPQNSLLLANFAQFLYLVVQDYDRAEDYFKRAVKAEPKDAEAFNKYANFLWQVRKDLWAAEETYLEAIDTEPDNSYYSANYAHFLWNTGAEDTCFPLNSPESSTEM